MANNTTSEIMPPALLDQLSSKEVELIAQKHGYNPRTVRRFLGGKPHDYNLKNRNNIKAVMATAIELIKKEIIKKNARVEELDKLVQKFLAA